VLLAAAAQVSTTKKAITTAKLLFMPFVFKAKTLPRLLVTYPDKKPSQFAAFCAILQHLSLSVIDNSWHP
jgi:hypothetical protein